jgi:hypothetical protein
MNIATFIDGFFTINKRVKRKNGLGYVDNDGGHASCAVCGFK